MNNPQALIVALMLICGIAAKAQPRIDSIRANDGKRTLMMFHIVGNHTPPIAVLAPNKDFSGKDSLGFVFYKYHNDKWEIIDTARALKVLMRVAELTLKLNDNE